MQQYADGRMQTRLSTDAVTQKLTVDPSGKQMAKESTNTRSRTTMLLKYMYALVEA